MPAAEIRDHETGLVSGPFSWYQSRQIFHETHEAEELYIFLFYQLKIIRNAPSRPLFTYLQMNILAKLV